MLSQTRVCLSFHIGTPRAASENYDDGLKYAKQIKRESPPIRSFDGAITKGKPYDGVTTIKEMGRSIHEIPRQDLISQESRKTPDSSRAMLEGSISQVTDGCEFFCVVTIFVQLVFNLLIVLFQGNTYKT